MIVGFAGSSGSCLYLPADSAGFGGFGCSWYKMDWLICWLGRWEQRIGRAIVLEQNLKSNSFGLVGSVELVDAVEVVDFAGFVDFGTD